MNAQNSIIKGLMAACYEQPIRLTFPIDEIVSDCLATIACQTAIYLRDQHGYDGLDSWDMRQYLSNDDYIGKKLVTRKGKLVKRLAKFVKENTGVELDNNFLGVLGSIISRSNPTSVNYFVDVTHRYNWGDGMFGKSDSCYWGQFAASRDTLEADPDTLCLRYYDDMYDTYGIGRCWIVRVPDNDNAVVLFNSYGIPIDTSALIVSTLLGGGYQTKKVELGNYETCIPYINGENNETGTSGKGRVLWLDGTPEPDDYIYMRLEVVHGDYEDAHEHRRRCNNCNSQVRENDAYVDDYGTWYCSDCHDELFSYCDACGDYWLNNDDMHQAHGGRYDGEYICESCLESHSYHKCEHCSEWHSEGVETDEEEFYCSDCADNNTFVCAECEHTHNNSDGTEVDGTLLCSECAHERDGLSKCAGCGEWKTDVEKLNDRIVQYCPECLPSRCWQCSSCGGWYYYQTAHTDVLGNPHCVDCWPNVDDGLKAFTHDGYMRSLDTRYDDNFQSSLEANYALPMPESVPSAWQRFTAILSDPNNQSLITLIRE